MTALPETLQLIRTIGRYAETLQVQGNVLMMEGLSTFWTSLSGPGSSIGSAGRTSSSHSPIMVLHSGSRLSSPRRGSSRTRKTGGNHAL